MVKSIIPFVIGLVVGFILYFTVGWWGFLVVFPWIGAAISLGTYLIIKLPANRKSIGRRIAILLILPVLLMFVPVFNNENFQLEGIILLILAGYYSKGVIHYAVAKVFGPLIWGRGFCGWACWTAAILDWLPLYQRGYVPSKYKQFRYFSLIISILLPIILVFWLNYDVRADYLGRREMIWMFTGNIIYYLLAIPLAFIFQDRRAFCKIVCPVSLIMKIPARMSIIKRSPSGKKCVKCGKCNQICPMDVDVMSYISNGEKVKSSECIHCSECTFVCPAGAIK